MNELALFAGAGGGILGGRILGWRTVCAVEFASAPRGMLLARQRDGHLERFPIWDDVRTFDGRPWRGHVDVISGGFPCQDISTAGKGAGIAGERSGLWAEMARVVDEVRPRFVFVENSPMLVGRGLGRVLGDLAALRYDAEWCVLGAVDAGAPHKRERIWILAYAGEVGREVQQHHDGSRALACSPSATCCERSTLAVSASSRGQDVADTHEARPQERMVDTVINAITSGRVCERGSGRWWSAEPELGRVADGVADRVDRIEAIGNGQVPAVVALAWRTLMARLT